LNGNGKYRGGYGHSHSGGNHEKANQHQQHKNYLATIADVSETEESEMRMSRRSDGDRPLLIVGNKADKVSPARLLSLQVRKPLSIFNM